MPARLTQAFWGLLLVFCQTSLLSFSAETATDLPTTNQRTWTYQYHTEVNSAGGFSAVQTFRRTVAFATDKQIKDTKERHPKGWDVATNVPDGHTQVVLHTGSAAGDIEMSIKTFRGPIYAATNSNVAWKNSHSQERWVTIIATLDNVRIAAGIDDGPLYTSTNSGASWSEMNQPGKNEWPIVDRGQDTGIFAVQKIQVNAPAVTLPNSLEKNSNHVWYAVAEGTGGGALVISGGGTTAIPVLEIALVGDETIISWPASFKSFALQQNLDLSTTNWTDVAAQPDLINGLNRITQKAISPRSFYRLRTASKN